MASLSVSIDKNDPDVLSDRGFLGAFGFFTTAGLAVTAACAWLSVAWKVGVGVALLLGLILPFLGILLANATRRWDVAWLGYLLVAGPLGFLLGPALAHYHKSEIVASVAITACVSGTLWLLGVLMPPIVRDLYGYILGALLVVIAGNVVRTFVPGLGVSAHLHWWAWACALLFSGLVVYDTNKALQEPKSMYTAVANSLNVYLDIVNLFLYLLEINSSKDD